MIYAVIATQVLLLLLALAFWQRDRYVNMLRANVIALESRVKALEIGQALAELRKPKNRTMRD